RGTTEGGGGRRYASAGVRTLPKIAPMSNPAIPKLIVAPFPCIGGAGHESKAIPTAAIIVTRRTLHIRDLPGTALSPGGKLSRMGYQKVTSARLAAEAFLLLLGIR